MKLFYAGIGSRDTPISICNDMTRIAKRLEELEYTLRSGGANGADTAFEDGVTDPTRKEIFLPWQGFNGNSSSLFFILPEAYEMAKLFHPAWDKCSDAARKFHARNCYQVLGVDLNTPVKFVVCWTPDGKPSGGTGQALRIAASRNIPVVNLYNPDPMNHIAALVY